MITIPHALSPEHVTLDLQAPTADDALVQVASLLKSEPRILDWKKFFQVMKLHPPCRISDGPAGLCIPHARTLAVEGLVMSAARLAHDLPFPNVACPVRYIFCVGVPQTMAADYLRLVGALMRIFKDPETEKLLREATSKQAFVETLGRFELKL